MRLRWQIAVKRALPLAIALTVSLVARGEAPADQYKTFGPLTDTIEDRYTNLVWQRVPVVIADRTYATADNTCRTLTLSGFNWRMPTIGELLTLVDEQPHLAHDSVLHIDTERFIDPNAFPDTPAEHFLVFSTDPLNRFWFVDFGTGMAGVESKPDVTRKYYVRCVKY